MRPWHNGIYDRDDDDDDNDNDNDKDNDDDNDDDNEDNNAFETTLITYLRPWIIYATVEELPMGQIEFG